jgi:putative phosphoesterase
MAGAVVPESVSARTVAVLADCHIHPGTGPDWSASTLAALAGVDLIVTLGDMGEAAGLERLAAIAPVMGVRGFDDSDDPRTAVALRALRLGDQVLGCVFDPQSAGLSAAKDPIAVTDGWAAADAAFGGRMDVLLYASTHKPAVDRIDGRLAVNPGSATLPDGVRPAFAKLTVADGAVDAEIVFLA